MVARSTWQPDSPGRETRKHAGKLERHFAVIAALQDSALGPTARHIIRAIEDFADNDTGEAWPSISKLSRVTGYCRQTIVTGIEEAVAKGWLIVKKGGGRRRPNVYRVVPPAPASHRRTV